MPDLELDLRRRLKSLQTRLGASTNAFRLLDGGYAAFPQTLVECFANRWLISTPSATPPPASLLEACEKLGAGTIYWKQLQKDGREAPVHLRGSSTSHPFQAMENGMRFLVDFRAGYSQGIFLDQRENRQKLTKLACDKSILNCFAYTCTFGLAAMLGGAKSCTHLDLSKHYLEWGKENYACNGLVPAPEDFIFGDVMDWLTRFEKSQRRFDWIILDPPTFSRNRKGKTFRVEKDLPELMALAASCLNFGGGIYISTNHRTLEDRKFIKLVREGLQKTPGRWGLKPGKMPPDFTGEQYLKSLFCHFETGNRNGLHTDYSA